MGRVAYNRIIDSMANTAKKVSNKAGKKERHLILGAGEVGQALYLVLSPHFDVSIRDKESDIRGTFDVLHIAYPPFKNFVAVTKQYIKEYKPSLVIIHSTVPVGTTKKVGPLAVHSPIRGMHIKGCHPGIIGASVPKVEGNPQYFANSLFHFPKYFGGAKAEQAARYFEKIGIPVQIFSKAETTELAKILDTTYYGWNIVFAKEAKQMCDKLGLDFNEVYTIPNVDYNEGYKKLGKGNVVRPVLKDVPGGIGGHCVVSNCDLLNSWVTNTIKERDKIYRKTPKKKQ